MNIDYKHFIGDGPSRQSDLRGHMGNSKPMRFRNGVCVPGWIFGGGEKEHKMEKANIYKGNRKSIGEANSRMIVVVNLEHRLFIHLSFASFLVSSKSFASHLQLFLPKQSIHNVMSDLKIDF